MNNTNLYEGPELWGGIECTINRVGNEFKDQLEYSGHYTRNGDLERVSNLGINAIRYPILWEKHHKVKNHKINWSWTDSQLDFIRSSGMTLIAGLLHHGSGPNFTNLLDPEFPQMLATYAYEVASRYPWVEYYTPVNEPLTTARFSGLYGLWYPHHKNEHSFYKMLINQLKGVVLTMEAIRSINPLAKLVQTEDLGKTHSTSLLEYQADFENDRRLLTFDILSGLLKPGHPHYEYILGCGINEEDLKLFQVHQAKPDIIGLNYYITSERWLDERIEKYPVHTHGSNGKHRYADTEIVRVNHKKPAGLKQLATDVWNRYQIPLAITEVHLHCTREEQLRWFKEIWDDAVMLSKNGIPVKGVTAWALLGSFDWDSLLTKTGTQYESGVFDIKTFPGELRPTALVTLMKTLTQHKKNKKNFHPVLTRPGWWHNEAISDDNQGQEVIILNSKSNHPVSPRSIKLAFSLKSACTDRRITNREVNDFNEIKWERSKPWAVIVVGETDAGLAEFCFHHQIQYVTFCKDEVLVYGLQIIAGFEPLSIHQINKVLDLMIDGQLGCWVFDTGEVVFKAAQQKMHC